jgi:[protein-PII] uridylyltransferase
MANRDELVARLDAAGLPAAEAGELIADVSDFWLLSDAADVLLGDLAQCFPALGPREVRAAARPVGRRSDQRPLWRLAVAAADRPGLLAATAGTIAAHGLSVVGASVATWADRGLALHGLAIVDADGRVADPGWDALATEVAEVLREERTVTVPFKPSGRVTVVCSPAPIDHSLVSIEAPDRVGLLWAITSWFATHGVNVVAAHLASVEGTAKDVFLVDGSPDPAQLAAGLSGGATRRFGLRRPRAR